MILLSPDEKTLKKLSRCVASKNHGGVKYRYYSEMRTREATMDVQIVFRAPSQAARKIDSIAGLLGTTRSAVLRRLLEQAVPPPPIELIPQASVKAPATASALVDPN